MRHKTQKRNYRHHHSDPKQVVPTRPFHAPGDSHRQHPCCCRHSNKPQPDAQTQSCLETPECIGEKGQKIRYQEGRSISDSRVRPQALDQRDSNCSMYRRDHQAGQRKTSGRSSQSQTAQSSIPTVIMLSNDVDRTLLSLAVESADVLAQHAQPDQLHTAQEQHHSD